MRVFIASPFSGDVERNLRYARACLLDSLSRHESPFMPHLIYPQVLDDTNLDHRTQGIIAGLSWVEASEKFIMYVDLGKSAGMLMEETRALRCNIPVEERTLEAW